MIRKIALSSLCCKYIDDILNLGISAPQKAIEWDLNFIPPTLSLERISNIRSFITIYDLEIRYHLPYSYVEVLHPNEGIREFSIALIKKYLDFIHILGGKVAVLHVGSFLDNEIYDTRFSSIKTIAEYAEKLGIKICVENLASGLTTNAHFLKDILRIENIFFCFDTGHADLTLQKQPGYLLELAELIKKKCIHSHIYKTEDSNYNHIAFVQPNEIENCESIKMLMKSNCNWYTMELDEESMQYKQLAILEALR